MTQEALSGARKRSGGGRFEEAREGLLSREEEAAIAQAMEAGREAGAELSAGRVRGARRRQLEEVVEAGRRAEERLLIANQGLVRSIARRYVGSGVPLDDLISEGNLGLMKAAERFDWRRGLKFSTYATWWIRQAILRGIEYSGSAIRLPSQVVVRERALAAAEMDLILQLRRRPSIAEIAEATGVEVELVREWRERASVLSLDDTVGEADEFSLGEMVADERADPETQALAEVEAAEVRRLLVEGGVITEREAEVLTRRFGVGSGDAYTLTEVGEALGVSSERVRQIETLAIAKLRRALWVRGIRSDVVRRRHSDRRLGTGMCETQAPQKAGKAV